MRRQFNRRKTTQHYEPELEYVYISEVDEKFRKAMTYLESRTCAVMGFFTQFAHLHPIALLAISTKNQNYLFDTLKNGESMFQEGFKDFFESDDTTKIVYDSRCFADCLKHLYGVGLKNVADAQLKDILLQLRHNPVAKTRDMKYSVLSHLGLRIYDQTYLTVNMIIDRPIFKDIAQVIMLHSYYLYKLHMKLDQKLFPSVTDYILENKDQSICPWKLTFELSASYTMTTEDFERFEQIEKQ